jgi:2-polyprenyl-3-methyl-5-hydroxy-6-metoxy-1,4-benzoquinol methylase
MNRPAHYYSHTREEVLPFLPQRIAKLLDVGCGAGAFGRLVKERWGAQVWGLEINAAAAAAAREDLDHVLVGDVHTALHRFAGQRFDCITCLDVLEHLVDPEAVLRQAAELLAPNGMLVAVVPNVLYIGHLIRLFVSKDWRYEDHGILDRSHVRFFTRKSFARTLAEAGFLVESIHGLNPCRHRLWFRLFDILTLGWLHEARYLQFLYRARLRAL